MALAVSLLAGCQPGASAGDKKPANNSQQQDDNKKPGNNQNQNNNDQNNNDQNNNDQNTENGNAGNNTGNNNQGNNSGATQDEKMQIPTDYKGEVLVDNDMFSVKVKSITLDSKYHLTFELVNKTQEQLAFRMYSPVLNGFMYVNYGHTSEFVSQTLNAGETKELEMHFKAGELEALGITRISEIVVDVLVVNYTNYKELLREDYTIRPFGDETVKKYEHKLKGDETLLLQTDELIVYGKVVVDKYEAKMQMYAENLSDKKINLTAYYMAVNGKIMDETSSFYLMPGAKAILEKRVSSYKFEKIGFKDASESVKFGFLWDVKEIKDTMQEPLYMKEGYMLVSGKTEADVPKLAGKGQVILDNEYCTIYQESFSFGDSPALTVSVVNKTDRQVNVSLSDHVIENKVNGLGTDSATLMSHSMKSLKVSWMLSMIKDAGVELGDKENGFIYSFKINVRDLSSNETIFETKVNGQF